MEDEKQVEGQEEQVIEPTSEEAGAEPPPTEPEPPSETTPYTKEKVAELISAAEAAVQSAKDKELGDLRRQQKQDIRQLKAQQEEEKLVSLEAQEKERLGDVEPDLLKEIHELRRRVHATVTQTSDVQAHGFAYKLGKQYGVDAEVLLESASPEEMETKAKEMSQTVKADAEKALAEKIKQLEEELAEAKKAPQKIDSGTTGASGVDFSKMSADEKVRWALGNQKII